MQDRRREYGSRRDKLRIRGDEPSMRKFSVPPRGIGRLALLVLVGASQLVCGSCGEAGTAPKPVPQKEIDTHPAWSPDGSQIVYFKEPKLGGGESWAWGVYIYDLSTERDSLLWENHRAAHLDWSPDGSRLAYSRNGDIVIYDFATQTSTTLPSATRDFYCSWSPDGRVLAYDSKSAPLGLWLIDEDGTNRRLKYDDARSVSWFSDGVTLAGIGLGSEVYLLDTSGVRYEKLTESGETKTEVAVAGSGDRIVYAERGELWLIDTLGSPPVQLTTKGGEYPEWSPDGDWIVFTKVGAEEGNLWIIRPDGTDEKQLTH